MPINTNYSSITPSTAAAASLPAAASAANTAASSSHKESDSKVTSEKQKIDNLVRQFAANAVEPQVPQIADPMKTLQRAHEITSEYINKINQVGCLFSVVAKSIKPQSDPTCWELANKEIGEITEEAAFIEECASIKAKTIDQVATIATGIPEALLDAAKVFAIKQYLQENEIDNIRGLVEALRKSLPNYLQYSTDFFQHIVKVRNAYREALFVADECLTKEEWQTLEKCTQFNKFQLNSFTEAHRPIIQIIKEIWSQTTNIQPISRAGTIFRLALKLRIKTGSLGFTRDLNPIKKNIYLPPAPQPRQTCLQKWCVIL